MTRNIILLYFISSLTLSGCSTTKNNSYFENDKSNIEKIAVLPFEIIFTGKIPKAVDEQMLEQIELEESVTFQNSFSKILIDQNDENSFSIQPVQKTLDILNNKNIQVRESWKMHPQQLAKILGVDAVVKSRIKRKIEIPNKKTQRHNTVIQILNITGIFSGVPAPLPQTQNPNFQNIKADYVLVESKEGDIIWKKSTSWSGDKNIALPQKADLINQNSYFIFP
ncbi:MAG: hypothetical protein AB8F94_27670 [Saprospiraceae bacterium]